MASDLDSSRLLGMSRDKETPIESPISCCSLREVKASQSYLSPLWASKKKKKKSAAQMAQQVRMT